MFGTYSHILEMIIPTDFHIFRRGETTKQYIYIYTHMVYFRIFSIYVIINVCVCLNGDGMMGGWMMGKFVFFYYFLKTDL